jgi:hypothetical protein
MKFWKHTLITAVSFLGIATTVLYTACEKDSCTDLKCKNGGSCAEGFCRCPSGYEGSECEIKTATRFVGVFTGNTRCNQSPGIIDTLEVMMKTEPNVVKMVLHSNITDTLVGTVNGNSVAVADYNENNQAKYVNVTLDRKKITLYVENVTNVAAGTKSVCNFIGYKP